MEYIVILSTIGREADAHRIAAKLINSKYAACINIIPGIQSIYEWEGKQCTDNELLLLIKTTKENEKDVYRLIDNLHPYETPEMISLPVQNGSKDYLNWIISSVKT
ncbi:MAG: divalent-cation tolerance protein CutA [Fidelibacterota bacterium]